MVPKFQSKTVEAVISKIIQKDKLPAGESRQKLLSGNSYPVDRRRLEEKNSQEDIDQLERSMKKSKMPYLSDMDMESMEVVMETLPSSLTEEEPGFQGMDGVQESGLGVAPSGKHIGG
ncbi:hypothetical protein PTKIN_Ptkin05aG0118000 [Pterospermum kingtungense]